MFLQWLFYNLNNHHLIVGHSGSFSIWQTIKRTEGIIDALGQDTASTFARHINISWNDAILGSVVNMDNDLENYLSGTWKGYKYGLKSKWD